MSSDLRCTAHSTSCEQLQHRAVVAAAGRAHSPLAVALMSTLGLLKLASAGMPFASMWGSGDRTPQNWKWNMDQTCTREK